MGPQALTWLLLSVGTVFAVLAVLACFAAMRLAPRFGYVDHPGAHKSHAAVTPYGGGVAMFVALWVPLLLAVALAALAPLDWIEATLGETARIYAGGAKIKAWPAAVMLLGGVALHVLGLVDDFKPLGATPKLVVMLGVGLLVAWVGDVRVARLAGEWASILITMLWIVVIVNAFNFLDNMDGLSAGVAAICLLMLVICSLLAGQVLVPALTVAFLGTIIGFLAFNFPPARMFMGDAGSLLVGYMIAIASVTTTYYESAGPRPPYAMAMPLVILAVPLYDFLTVITIRIQEGRSMMSGDQRHFSHRLVEHGLSRRGAVLTIYLATAATGLAGTLLPTAGLRETLTVGLFVVSVLAIIAILETPPERQP